MRRKIQPPSASPTHKQNQRLTNLSLFTSNPLSDVGLAVQDFQELTLASADAHRLGRYHMTRHRHVTALIRRNGASPWLTTEVAVMRSMMPRCH
jgi:hypothetical protein